MFITKKLLLFIMLLMPVFVFAQQAAPVITDFNPKSVIKGQSIRIIGQNLAENVGFINVIDQATISATGTLEESSTALTVTVPPTLRSGNYIISVSGPGGSTNTGLETLMLKDASFAPSSYTVPAAPTLLGVSTFADLIGVIFNYSFQILGVVIFITFVWSGFMWLTSGGNPGTIGKARSKMTSAILGGILLLSSYLILNTINPDLVNVGFTLKGIDVKKEQLGGQPPLPGTGTLSQQEALRQFQATGIAVAGPIRLEGIRQTTVNEVIRLKQECGCEVTVTSATGGQHASGTFDHSNGYKVDLRVNAALNNYIQKSGRFQSVPPRSDGALMYQRPDGKAIYALESNHWDVVVRP